jgi:large subunit ribosomal protein L13
MSTPVLKESDLEHKWYTVDVEGKVLGRVASDIAYVLRGKHKPNFAPYLDNGDYVIVVNAEKIAVTGNRLSSKMYYRHSGYPGGLRSMSLQQMLQTHPERALEIAVRGMLPKNKLGDQMMRKLRVYAGPGHPHEGQKPVDLLTILDRGRALMRDRKQKAE